MPTKKTDSKEPKVHHRSIGSFSGAMIRGRYKAMKEPSIDLGDHWLRCFWLSIMVESGGKAGAIMMADGTGVTAALEQQIAVYPRNLKVQGPLFKMLRRLDNVFPISYYKLGELFELKDWMISDDGLLRVRTTGEAVDPRIIRNTFTPKDGKVPKSGVDWEQCKMWALAFHEVFAHKETIPMQVSYGKELMIKHCQRQKHHRLSGKTIEERIYGGECFNPRALGGSMVQDLAMAMFWNYRVNAPSKAMECLQGALSHDRTAGDKFARKLVLLLRTNKYGRWATNRYDRSRQHARKIWPEELFIGRRPLMPARKH
jgi:hypothetical protein